MENFEPHFWEFIERVWNGETYTDSLCRDLPGLESGNRPLCKGYRRGEQGWWFVLNGGNAVLVPDANVRFIWGKAVAVNSPGNRKKEDEGVGEQKDVEHKTAFGKTYEQFYDQECPEKEEIAKAAEWANKTVKQTPTPLADQNGFPVSKAQAAYAAQDNTRSLADYAETRLMPTPEGMATVQPKRRGRPPKVRPVE